MQHARGIFGDHLDVAIEQYPVARGWLVSVAQRVPALMRLRILQDRDNSERPWIRVNPDVGPLVERPGVRATPGHPALLANHLGGQLQRQAGKGGARFTMVDTV